MAPHIDADHFPLGFQVAPAQARSPFLAGEAGQETFKVEARQMFGHQKEARLTEGEQGAVWRLSSDEGLHLKGTDLAPFPLGFFNAGVQGEIIHAIVLAAKAQGVALKRIRLKLVNHYWLTGSFVLGTGEGHAEPTDIDIQIDSPAPAQQVDAVVKTALARVASLDLLSAPRVNTFAIYLNGARRQVVALHDSPPAPVADPFMVHARAPRPLAGTQDAGIIEKLPTLVAGELHLAPAGTTTKIVRDVFGESEWQAGQNFSAATSWLGVPGTTHFTYRMDVGGTGQFPSALGMVSAGITFCFMTQLSRYIENMKLAIDGIRVVQFNPYALAGEHARALPLDTHLFLNGSATEEVCTQLLSVSERTCYLHTTASKALPPNIDVALNGVSLAR